MTTELYNLEVVAQGSHYGSIHQSSCQSATGLSITG